MKKTCVVIAGGGFAGLSAAMYLDKTLARREDVAVTLISQRFARLIIESDRTADILKERPDWRLFRDVCPPGESRPDESARGRIA